MLTLMIFPFFVCELLKFKKPTNVLKFPVHSILSIFIRAHNQKVIHGYSLACIKAHIYTCSQLALAVV